MFGDHGLCGLLKEGVHGKSPKCLDGNLGDFGEFCKGLGRANLSTSSKQAGIRFSTSLFNRNPQAKPYLKISARAGMAIVSKSCLFKSTIFRHADGRKQKERIEYALFYMGN